MSAGRKFRLRPQWDKPRPPSSAELRASHHRLIGVSKTKPEHKRAAVRRRAQLSAGRLTVANGLARA